MRRRPPLRLRLPNPPPVFVGRSSERDLLAGAIERGPVTAVVGAAGIGKTALTLLTLHTRFADRIDDALFFGVRPGDGPEHVVRAILTAAGSHDADPPVGDDPDALLEAMLDAVEQRPFLVVLDDVHHASDDAAGMAAWLGPLATYARASRFVVTSRNAPPWPRPQIVALEGLQHEELVELALAFDPELSLAQARKLASSAAGSPWLLSQAIAGGPQAMALNRDRLLAGLPAASAALLRVLSAFSRPIPLDVLAQLHAPPSELELRALEHRGLLVIGPLGLRVPDVVAALLETKQSTQAKEWLRAARDVLRERTSPDAIIEAARLSRELEDDGALQAILGEQGSTLIDLGYAPQLWSVLKDVSDRRLADLRLRCAAELGTPTALGRARATSVAPARGLAWAAALLAQGEIDAAADVAGALRELSPGVELAGEAARLQARCRMHQGRLDEALSVLASERGDATPALRVLCSTRKLGEAGYSRVRVDGLESLCDHAEALLWAGRPAEARAVLGGTTDMPPALLTARRAMLLEAFCACLGGQARRAAELLAAVRPFLSGPTILTDLARSVEAALARMQGHRDDGVEPLRRACRESIDEQWRQRLVLELEVLHAARADASGESLEPIGDDHSAAWTLDLARRFRLARQTPVTELPSYELGSSEQRVWWGRLCALAAIWTGDLDVAAEHTAWAGRSAEHAGLGALFAETLIDACDLELIRGDGARLARAREALETALAKLDLPAASDDAQFFAAMGDPAVLRQAASSRGARASRRSRALLGESTQLDEIDRRVLSALAARSGAPTLHPVGRARANEGSAWGLDERDSSVFLPNGKRIALGTRPQLWRVLMALVEHGGAASKGDLFASAWGSTYHPLRHDSRIHVSIRSLRQLIEDDASRPARIVTTEDGYRLGGSVERIRGAG